MGLRIRAVGRSAEGARRKEAERGRGGGVKWVMFMGCRTVPKGKKGGKGKPRDVVFSSLGASTIIIIIIMEKFWGFDWNIRSSCRFFFLSQPVREDGGERERERENGKHNNN